MDTLVLGLVALNLGLVVVLVVRERRLQRLGAKLRADLEATAAEISAALRRQERVLAEVTEDLVAKSVSIRSMMNEGWSRARADMLTALGAVQAEATRVLDAMRRL